jgi:GTP-binding protein HflX
MSKAEQETLPKALLVFVNPEEEDDEFIEAELKGLCAAANVEPVGYVRQRVARPTTATYLGKGKTSEIAAAAKEMNVDYLIVDEELTGIQTRNVQDEAGIPVIDRTQLILDIFARRARSKEGMLQVELAQLSYMLPKLMSVYTKFERQKGGIGLRGPGETKLETDRRMVRDRIARLKTEIEEVRKHRDQQRSGRRKYPFPFASMVGYTSAGKSTLMNRLAGTDLLADEMPFATLDPTTRKLDLEEGYSLFLTDTVGFISRLPTQLVAAFRATLEEIVVSDFLIHLVDVSHPKWQVQHDAVLETLADLGCDQKPMITVLNKIDRLPSPLELELIRQEMPDAVAISARDGTGLPQLMEAIISQVKSMLQPIEVVIPYSESGLVQECYEYGRVHQVDYEEEGIRVRAELVAHMRNKLAPYSV